MTARPSIEAACDRLYGAAMTTAKVSAILARHNLQPEPITSVTVAHLPGGEPVIALYQASSATPVHSAVNMADRLAVELEWAGVSGIASRIREELEKIDAERKGAGGGPAPV